MKKLQIWDPQRGFSEDDFGRRHQDNAGVFNLVDYNEPLEIAKRTRINMPVWSEQQEEEYVKWITRGKYW